MKAEQSVIRSGIILVVLAVFYLMAGSAGAADRVAVKASIANMRSGPGTNYEVL